MLARSVALCKLPQHMILIDNFGLYPTLNALLTKDVSKLLASGLSIWWLLLGTDSKALDFISLRVQVWSLKSLLKFSGLGIHSITSYSYELQICKPCHHFLLSTIWFHMLLEPILRDVLILDGANVWQFLTIYYFCSEKHWLFFWSCQLLGFLQNVDLPMIFSIEQRHHYNK